MNKGTIRLCKALELKHNIEIVLDAITADNHGTMVYTVDGKPCKITIDELELWMENRATPLLDEWMLLGKVDNPKRLKYFQNMMDIQFGVDYDLIELRTDGSILMRTPFDGILGRYEELLSTSFDVENWLGIDTNKADAEAYNPIIPRDTCYSVKGK